MTGEHVRTVLQHSPVHARRSQQLSRSPTALERCVADAVVFPLRNRARVISTLEIGQLLPAALAICPDSGPPATAGGQSENNNDANSEYRDAHARLLTGR